MAEYRTGKYFKAKPKKDFIYFFPLRGRKKQSNAETSDIPFRKFISSFFHQIMGTSSVGQTMNE